MFKRKDGVNIKQISRRKYLLLLSKAIWYSPIQINNFTDTYLIKYKGNKSIIINAYVRRNMADISIGVLSKCNIDSMNGAMDMLMLLNPRLSRIMIYLLNPDELKFFVNQRFKFNFEALYRNHVRLDGELKDLYVYAAYPNKSLNQVEK